MRLFTFTLSLLILFTAGIAHAGKLYRWVDKDGNVHYTDKIPPDQVEQARDELSEKGFHKQTTRRAKTREEVEKERELKRLRKEQARLIEKQKAEDRVLLRTFRSEDDIILARDGKIESIDVMVRITQGNIRRHQTRLAGLQRKAASMERSGRVVPDHLVTSINSTLKAINDGYVSIEQRENEKDTITDVFDKDLKRFRELKRLAPVSDDQPSKKRARLNLVRCNDNKACGAAWKRAEAFVRKHANTRMQMLSDSIIMTAAPIKSDEISITISRIREKDSGDTVLFMDLYCKNTTLGEELCAGEKVRTIKAAYRTDVGGTARGK